MPGMGREWRGRNSRYDKDMVTREASLIGIDINSSEPEVVQQEDDGEEAD